jgi:hypothetical protein
MVRRLGLSISYFISILYILLILWPSVYCFQHGCKGPDLDAFMPAFAFTPIGAIGTAFSLRNALQNIRKKQCLWLFWPLAIIFTTVLLGVVTLVALIIYYTAFRR